MFPKLLGLAGAVLLLFVSSANAAPSIVSVTLQDRHPAVTFSAPGADVVSIRYATGPQRGTDGAFFSENVKHVTELSDPEVAAGYSLDANAILPGTYYVLLKATDYGCSELDPGCSTGYSQMLTLTVPAPPAKKVTYKAKVSQGFIAEFELVAKNLLVEQPYKLCWERRGLRQKCVRSTLKGDEFSDETTDSRYLTVSELKLKNKRNQNVRFKWYVGNKIVARKTVRITDL